MTLQTDPAWNYIHKFLHYKSNHKLSMRWCSSPSLGPLPPLLRQPRRRCSGFMSFCPLFAHRMMLTFSDGNMQVSLHPPLKGCPKATKTMTYPPAPTQIPVKFLSGQLLIKCSLPAFAKYAWFLGDLMEEQFKGVVCIHVILPHFSSKQSLLGCGDDCVLWDKLGLGKKERKPTKLSLLSFTVNCCKSEAWHKSWGFQRALREADLGLTLNLICSVLKEAALEKCPYT